MDRQTLRRALQERVSGEWSDADVDAVLAGVETNERFAAVLRGLDQTGVEPLVFPPLAPEPE